MSKLRIAFVVGTYEPGKSGVGDYTRIFALRCAALGHATCVVSIADEHATGIVAEMQQGISTLRLSSRLPAAQRRVAAEEFLATFAPDFISLQFVAYSFDKRGNVYNIGTLLPRLKNVPLQIMMHELWIGAEQGAIWKDRLFGGVQRHFILSMLRRLRPQLVHTSTPAYRARLEAEKIATKILPLVSTISIAPSHEAWLSSTMANAGVANFTERRAETWLFVLFGSLYAEWKTERLFSQLETAARRAGKRVVIVSVGNQGGGRAHWMNVAQKNAGRFTFVSLGERAPAEVSQILSAADFGLSTSPWLLAGKSSTTAAMLAHGLPVLVSRDDVRYAGLDIGASTQPQLYQMSDDLSLAQLKCVAPAESSAVVEMFVADLERLKR